MISHRTFNYSWTSYFIQWLDMLPIMATRLVIMCLVCGCAAPSKPVLVMHIMVRNLVGMKTGKYEISKDR